MKLPKAQQLPSGAWRIQLQVDGERYSFVDSDLNRVKQMAKDAFAGIDRERRSPLTLGMAYDRYIESKTGVLSPATILGYKMYRNNYLQSLMDKRVSDLTQENIQYAISFDSNRGKSPKTIRNVHGLLSAVLKVYRPGFSLNTRLPQKQPYEIKIPTDKEIQQIWSAAKGTIYELPILLASWMGLRMSEIKGLKFSDIKNGHIHIQRAIVRGPDGEIVKLTKSYSGDRWIKCPEILMNMINDQPKDSGFICNYPAISLYKGFVSICEGLGLEHFRFHDLRHFAASEAHALGVPDKYEMHRMGHKTDHMLKNVYQHTMRDKEDEFADIIDAHMGNLWLKTAHENAHVI